MKYLLLSLVLITINASAQNIKISSGPIKSVRCARFEKPLVIKNTPNSILVAVYEHDDNGNKNIIIFETDDIQNKGVQKAKYLIGNSLEFFLWTVVDQKIFVVVASDSTNNYFAQKKHIFGITIDENGNESAKRNFGFIYKYSFGITVSENKRNLLFWQRNSPESEEYDLLKYQKLAPSTLKTISEAEIQVERDEKGVSVLLSNNGIIYNTFSIENKASREYFYKEIDMDRDLVAEHETVVSDNNGYPSGCTAFLIGETLAFAGVLKHKGDFTIYTKVLDTLSDEFISDQYELSDEQKAMFYINYADEANKSMQVMNPGNLMLVETMGTSEGTFLFFECYARNHYHFYNDLFLLKLNNKFNLSKVGIFPKRINSIRTVAGYGRCLVKDSLKIFYYEIDPKYKNKFRRLSGSINPYLYASDYSPYTRIVALSLSIKSPQNFSQSYYSPKFIKRGFMIEWKYLLTAKDGSMLVVADSGNKFMLVSLLPVYNKN